MTATVRCGSASPGSATGDRTWRATSPRSRAASSPAAATRDPQARERAARLFPGARICAELDELLADPSLDAVALATPVPSHAELAVERAGGRQALLRGEAAGPVGGRRRAGGGRGRGERSRADGRTPARVPPRGAPAQGAWPTPASSASRSSTSTATGSTSASCAPTRTRSGAWARTTSRSSSTSPARSPARRWPTASPTSGAACRTSCSASCASPPGSPRTCTCHGSTRTRSGASRSSAHGGWRPSTTWSSSAS